MADFDPDAFLATPAAPAGGFDPDAFLKGSSGAAPGQGASHIPPFVTKAASYIPKPLRDIPEEIYNAGASALHEMNAVNPWGEERAAAQARREAPSGTEVPRAVAGTLALAGSPITGTARSVGGHLLELLNNGMRAGAVKLYGEDKVRQAEAAAGHPVGGGGYEQAKHDADSLMMGLGPKGGMRPPVAAAGMPPPIPPPQADMLGVMLSEGQRTGAVPAIQREQSALAGRLGPAAAEQAKAFDVEQRGQVAAAHEGVRQSFDPFGQVVAETPQEAGQVVSQSVQNEAATRKAGVDAAYTQARGLPGEISANTFRDMGTQIKHDLSSRAEPVIIDDKLTPYASQAIQDIDNRVAQLQIQNRAFPLGQPPQNTIAGVTLNGVDQMRKRLSAFRQQAFGSGNASDGRAVKSVIDGFDTAIDHAINNGQFTGDARAIQAWNDARAAHADFRSTFTAQKNDPIGRVVNEIRGGNPNLELTPNKVADHLYGASGVNPSSVNVGVANRVKKILGEQSPEWSGVKQGLFSRLTETPEGVTDWGSQKISNNINSFLNGRGRELAEAIFTPQERQLLQEYANLHKKLVVPPLGAQPSNTSTMVAPILRQIGSKIGTLIGIVGGGVAGHAAGIPFAGEAIGYGAAKASGAMANAKEARQVARQMPLIAEQMARYQRALAAQQRTNAPLSNRTASVALANLSKSLQPLGIDAYQLAPTRADEEKRQRGGRLEGQPDQREQDEAHMADGGVPSNDFPDISNARSDRILNSFTLKQYHPHENADPQIWQDEREIPHSPPRQDPDYELGWVGHAKRGGRIPGFAHGGRLETNTPPLKGARKARDGHWYVSDHTRPGKYLRVIG